eukprot:m.108572 g.108572  ORF g.108572 m.108572 type:complete len:66 (-) comp27889_c0_seq5:66-263(-)
MHDTVIDNKIRGNRIDFFTSDSIETEKVVAFIPPSSSIFNVEFGWPKASKIRFLRNYARSITCTS